MTAPCTCTSACANVREKPFYVHEYQCKQILNSSSPAFSFLVCFTNVLVLLMVYSEVPNDDNNC